MPSITSFRYWANIVFEHLGSFIIHIGENFWNALSSFIPTPADQKEEEP